MRMEIIERVDIPEGVEFSADSEKILAKCGDKEILRKFSHKLIDISVKDNQVIIEAKNSTKRENRQIKTMKAHITNMVNGVKENFKYILEIVYVHFPITVKIENNQLTISNFLGEKKPRVYKIPKGVEVSLDGNRINVESHNKEWAGQVAASIEKTTRVRKKDKRKFQDGIYIVEKAGRVI